VAYRVFPSGQVPTAEVLQKYLMDQVVITCVSTARPPNPVPGMTVFETDTGVFRAWYGGVWARIGHAGAWSDGGALVVPGGLTVTGGGATVTGSLSATGTVSGAALSTTGDVTARGTIVSRLVKGKVGTGTTSTNISTTTDTNLGAANVQNVPVVAGMAYRLTVAIDYNRSGGSGTLDRLEFKAWNGSVGGTQLGGTVRHAMSGPLSAANRNVVMLFLWAAPSTQTIANLNISAKVTNNQSTWTAEVNQAYVATVEELGDASLISNL
jgi:hypothetical protein